MQMRHSEPHACVCSQPASEQAGTHTPGGGGLVEESPQQSLPPQPPSLPSLGQTDIQAVGSILSPAVFPHPSLHI